MSSLQASFPRALRLLRTTILLTVAQGGALTGRLDAQEVVSARLEGQVILVESPLDAGLVVLHRVGPEESGAIDSVPVGTDGRFHFTLPHVPDPENRSEVFFASIRYHGILYFGQPISTAIQLDSLYQIYVYDTVAAPEGGATLPLSMRNLFLESQDDGWRVTDLFEIRNEGTRTLFSPEEGAVWSYPLPADLLELQVGQTDLSPDALTYADGSIHILSPIPPGERVFVVQYRLPGIAASIPTPGSTELFELLVREPAPTVEVSRLQPVQPVELEPGSTYRRFTGAELGGGSVEVSPGQGRRGFSAAGLAVILALFLGAAGIFAFMRTGPASSHRAEVTPGMEVEPVSREGLIEEIARLDEAFNDRASPTSEERRSYERDRKKLVNRLSGLG